MRAALNSQDGMVDDATLTAGFSLPSMRLHQRQFGEDHQAVARPTTKAPATNPAFLPTGATSLSPESFTYGTDFTADVSPDVDSAGKILRITPLKPLDFSTGPAVNDSGPNIGKVLNVATSLC